MSPTIRSAALGFLLAPPAVAGETLRNGPHTVEFVGLEGRTAAEIHQRLGGGDGTTVHYCAADLVAKAGLHAASVVLHPQPDGGFYCVVTAVETKEQQQGELRAAPPAEPIEERRLATLLPLAALLDRDESLRNAVHLFAAARSRFDAAELGRQMVAVWGERPAVDAAFAQLDELMGDESLDLAAALATHAGAASLRRAALATLANFADREEAWRALVAACLDADESVRGDARAVLHGFRRVEPQPVDWSPVRAEIEALLGGADLWTLPVVVEALAATAIDRELLRSIVCARPRLLLALAAAHHEPTRAPARRLLAIAAGRDCGDDLAAWRAALEAKR